MTNSVERSAAEEPEERAGAAGGGITTAQKIVLLVLLAPFAGLFLPSLTLLLVGMLPTLAARVAEPGRERHLVVTVGLLNFCGCMPLLVELWSLGQSFHVIGAVMRDVYGWLVAYSAAGFGWLIYLMMPPFVAAYYRVVTDSHLRTLKRTQRKLVEIWGEEIAEAPPAAKPRDPES